MVPVELLGFVWGGAHDAQWYRLLLCLRVWLRVVKLRKVYTFYRDFLRDDNAVVNMHRLGALLALCARLVARRRSPSEQGEHAQRECDDRQ